MWLGMNSSACVRSKTGTSVSWREQCGSSPGFECRIEPPPRPRPRPGPRSPPASRGDGIQTEFQPASSISGPSSDRGSRRRRRRRAGGTKSSSKETTLAVPSRAALGRRHRRLRLTAVSPTSTGASALRPGGRMGQPPGLTGAAGLGTPAPPPPIQRQAAGSPQWPRRRRRRRRPGRAWTSRVEQARRPVRAGLL